MKLYTPAPYVNSAVVECVKRISTSSVVEGPFVNTLRSSVRRMLGVALGAAAAGVLGATFTAAHAQVVPALVHEKYTLPNGLEVILAEDHSVPLVAVNTWFKVGSGDELIGRTGFAHLFEHIMFMGSENVQIGR